MLTVAVDIAFGLGKSNLSTDEVKHRVEKALAAVGMSDYSQVSQLIISSHLLSILTLSDFDMKMNCLLEAGSNLERRPETAGTIAGALAELSKVLLLDELTTYLDETDQMGVIEAVKNCVGGHDQVAALLVTHPLEELQYADGAIYMEDGRVVMHDKPSSVLDYIRRKQDDYSDLINS